ncbi:hypothetical protein SUGI_1036390 [Cryptomeria japonica]|nr:hypothetical protein SUGI_1036390 [Cryptomeria japonica]
MKWPFDFFFLPLISLIFIQVEEDVASRGRARALSYLQHDAGHQNYFGLPRQRGFDDCDYSFKGENRDARA